MTNIEHLIENGLDAVEEAKKKGEDTLKAFWDAMDAWHNREMLKNVSMTKDELWEAVQYLVYTYCWCCPKRAEIEDLKADKQRLEDDLWNAEINRGFAEQKANSAASVNDVLEELKHTLVINNEGNTDFFDYVYTLETIEGFKNRGGIFDV